MPDDLARDDLTEVTAQPLLNYLVALSYTRKTLDFSRDINLNSIYADLIAAVHERGYEKRRAYAPIRHMKVQDFSRVLEEIGLAAWHGDGRTTSVREIEDHCRASGLGGLLDVFQDGAKAGVTRLLAAFFFRQYGQRVTGDPTFVFTHKSFGEYLAARRIVRAVERVVRELESRAANPDGGWDERDALKHWAQICGPSPITQYLHVYLLNDLKLRSNSDLQHWQERIEHLFNYMLMHGMPMEQVGVSQFKESLFQSRNAEEALLVVVNACARQTTKRSVINQHDPTAFGAWFKRMQGQRSGPDSGICADCLSFLDLSGSSVDIADLYGANLGMSNLEHIDANYTCFAGADLGGASIRHGQLWRANLEEADLSGANLEEAHLGQARLKRASLAYANCERASFERADLEGANLTGANLRMANLEGARLRDAVLDGVELDDANLKHTILEKRV